MDTTTRIAEQLGIAVKTFLVDYPINIQDPINPLNIAIAGAMFILSDNGMLTGNIDGETVVQIALKMNIKPNNIVINTTFPGKNLVEKFALLNIKVIGKDNKDIGDQLREWINSPAAQ